MCKGDSKIKTFNFQVWHLWQRCICEIAKHYEVMIKVMQLWIRDGDAYMQEKKQKKEINVHYLKMHTHSVNRHV